MIRIEHEEVKTPIKKVIIDSNIVKDKRLEVRKSHQVSGLAIDIAAIQKDGDTSVITIDKTEFIDWINALKKFADQL
jgi:hypothetical protein